MEMKTSALKRLASALLVTIFVLTSGMATAAVQIGVDDEGLMLSVNPVMWEMNEAITRAVNDWDFSMFEVEYHYDTFGNHLRSFTDEAWSEIIAKGLQLIDEVTYTMPDFVLFAEEMYEKAKRVTAQSIQELKGEYGLGETELSPMFLETTIVANVLNLIDGISEATASRSDSISAGALIQAAIYHPFDSWARDVRRHFIWARNVTNEFNSVTARVVTNNREWASAVIRQGFALDSWTIIMGRTLLHSIALHSLHGFDQVFNTEDVMDFWNNRVGIQQGNRSFNDLRNSGSFIMHPDQAWGLRQSMWSSFWWRHPALWV